MSRSARSAVAAIFAAAVAAACGGDPEVPAAQSQTRSTQQLNSPASVTGCLRAGETSNTFVLTTSSATEGTAPATYQLDGGAGVDLRAHVGHRVEVTGIIGEQQHVATREAPQRSDEKATGTTGTPTVQTSTQLALRTMQVKQVRPLEGSCE